MDLDRQVYASKILKSLGVVKASHCTSFVEVFDRFYVSSETDLSQDDIADFFDLLVSLLSNRNTCVSAAHFFSSLLPTAVSYALGSKLSHQNKCAILGNLIAFHPDILEMALLYFEDHYAPWTVDDSHSKGKKRKKENDSTSDLETVISCWNFLKYSWKDFVHLWNWCDFASKFLNISNKDIKWLSLNCIALLFCMGESQKRALLENAFDCQEIDFLNQKYQDILLLPKLPYFSSDSPTDISSVIKNSNQLISIIDICGISLPVNSPNKDTESNLVLVDSTKRNLRNLALSIASSRAICLTGEVGCGKTALVDYIANKTGNGGKKLLKIQLGEDTDSKMLLGSYKCTDLPGEFVWQPGILTQAVVCGQWLLIEDIESASSDVAAVLAGLLENNSLSVPGFRDNISVSPGFRLFMTHRLFQGVHGYYGKQSTAMELLSQHWLLVKLDPLSECELITIIQSNFPTLHNVASKMVSAYSLFSFDSPETINRSGRMISTRDLLKWCKRSVSGFKGDSQETALKILQDAIDIFCSSYSDSELRSDLAGKVAARLGIIKTKADFFLKIYKPPISVTDKSVKAGRAILNRPASDSTSVLSFQGCRFAFTQPSSCLLERVAICLSLKEPVLLVGETGTGKTSTVQLLAEYTGNKLVVINMNQQSDSSDLLGGYKPVDIKFLISPLRDTFEALFRSHYNVSKNLKFLENISHCYNQKRWQALIKLMMHSQSAAVKRLRENDPDNKLKEWLDLGQRVHRLNEQLKSGHAAMAFSFIEGSLIEAIKKGYWVLLDEINLAPAETLQCLSSLLEGDDGSLTLLETGNFGYVKRHPSFRLIAAMNPSTDVGKKRSTTRHKE